MLIEALKPKCFIGSLNWICSQQNRDGSWGKSSSEKIRWTSNALITLHELGFSVDHPPVSKGISWLLSCTTEIKEWYLSVPALLAFGYKDELEKNGQLNTIGNLFDSDRIGGLPIKVALFLQLRKHGVNLGDAAALEASILRTLTEEGPSLRSFSGSTNYTSLYCEFLAVHDYGRHQEIISKCVDWILLRKLVSIHDQSVCWENSYGKTAYVLINLLNVPYRADIITQLIDRIFEHFQSDKYGAIPPDTVAAYKSTSSIYTTILFIRMYAVISNVNPFVYKKLFIHSFAACNKSRSRNRLIKWLVKKVLIVCLPFLAVGGPLYYVGDMNFNLSILASLIAAAVVLVLTAFWKKTSY